MGLLPASMPTKKGDDSVVDTLRAPSVPDPLADAKAAFDSALTKTKAQQGLEEPLEEPKAQEPKPKRLKAQKEGVPLDEAKNDAADLRAELETLRKEFKERQKQEASRDTERPSDLDEVAGELAEQFGDEEGAALSAALKRLLEPREQRLAKIEMMLEEGMKRGRAQTIKSNKSRLVDGYPQLKNELAWEAVQDRANKLFGQDPDKYTTIEEAYDATVKALFGKPSGGELPTEDEEIEASRIAASQMTTPGRQKQESKMTANQKSWAIFEHLRKNPEDLQGAKKLARTLRATE